MTKQQLALWDEFAKAALAAIVAKSPYAESMQHPGAGVPDHVQGRARGAACYADAMLTERAKRVKPK